MYKRMFGLMLIGLCLLVATGSKVSAGIVEHWNFDDAVGSTTAVGDNGHNGTVQQATFTGPGGGQDGIGGAISFNGGVYEWVSPPANTLATINGKISVALWMKGSDLNPANPQGSTMIAGYGPGWIIWINVPDNQYGKQIFFNSGGNAWSVPASASASGDGKVNEYKNKWNHWAFTHDSTTGDMKMYLNGNLFNSLTGATKSPNGSGAFLFTIGNHPYGQWNYVGLLDDMYIYDYALSAGEVGRLAGTIDLGVAYSPNPTDGASNVPSGTALTLSWSKGNYAASHRVYLGTVFADVNSATTGYATTPVPSYTMTQPAVPNVTYYWRVDEVNGTNVWKGSVWNFTTFASVDNFESYADTDALKAVWVGNPADEPGYTYVNLDTDVFNGGAKAMRLENWTGYAPYFIEAKKTFATAQDWTAGGLKVLSLWIRGNAGNTIDEPIYVKLKDGAATPKTVTLTCPIAGASQDPNWQVWDIDLTTIGSGSLDKTKIKSVTVGNGGTSSSNVETPDMMYVDDIVLYPSRCLTPQTGDLNGDCKVDFLDFAVLSGNWLGNGMWP